MNKTNDTKPATHELTEDELSLVSGGAVDEATAEARIFQALSSAVSEVMKNLGSALSTAARGG